MAVSIEFLGMQRAVVSMDRMDMPASPNTKVRDALKYVRQRHPNLDLDESMMLIIVNLKTASLDTALKDNDTVSFLPIIGGG
jgi:molybdopterin converting factor small subunit